MELLDPVLVCDLFPLELRALLQLLQGLDEQAWHTPTVCAGWSVKDIAQHLLADDLGILSRKRDSFDYLSIAKTPYNLDSWDELVAFINEMNAIWVQATRRLSGQVLCTLLEFSGEELYHYFSTLDSYAMGDPVSWAGPAPAPCSSTRVARHRARIYRALATPAADTRCCRQARIKRAGVLCSSAGNIH
ncbi:MAG: hypothetical protein E6I32_19765 [Chloroflexi bacterium]|nr:MAG: hypothetical protein E6I32_19765 [Chloroflexota bacterium]